MTFEKFQQQLMRNDIIHKISNKNTHVSLHTDMTIAEDIDRSITEHKQAHSRFHIDPNDNYETTHEKANHLIEEALLYNARQIYEFITTGNDYEKKSFHTEFEKEDYGSIGTGIIYNPDNNMLKEYETQHMKVVLRKTPHKPLGFTLVTAYPDMEQHDIKPTETNLRNHIKETNAYKNGDEMYKLYLRHITHSGNTHLTTYRKGNLPRESCVILRVPASNPNMEHTIKMKSSGMTIRTYLKEHDDNGHEMRTYVNTQYTRLQQGISGEETYTADLTNKRIFQAFQQDYPEVGSQIQYLQQYFYEKNKRRQESYRSNDYTHKPSRGKQAESKFGHIKNNTIENQQEL